MSLVENMQSLKQAIARTRELENGMKGFAKYFSRHFPNLRIDIN